MIFDSVHFKGKGENTLLVTLVWGELIYSILFGMFVNLGLPLEIRMGTDCILAMLIMIACYRTLKKKELLKNNRIDNATIASILLWTVYSLLNAICRGISFVAVLASSRNWIKGFAFLIICNLIINKRAITRIYNFLFFVFIANFVVVLAEFFFFGYKGDDLSGVLLDNGSTNVFLLIILTFFVFLLFIEQRVSLQSVVVVFISLIIASMEEIKVFYFEFAAIVVLFGLIQLFQKEGKFLTVKFWFISICALGVSMLILFMLHPHSMPSITSVEGYMHYEETSKSAYTISRVHAISQITKEYFNGEIRSIILGKGLGSTFLYGSKVFFTGVQKLYFEGGIIGLFLYCLFFVGISIREVVDLVRTRIFNWNSVYLWALCGCAMILLVYDSALYKECAYMFFFALATGLINREHADKIT